MSNQLMNPDFAIHFVALLSCIWPNRTKFTYINQTMYQLDCKLFIFSFSCMQTIYLGFFDFANNFFQDFSSPPLSKKIMVRALTCLLKLNFSIIVVKILHMCVMCWLLLTTLTVYSSKLETLKMWMVMSCILYIHQRGQQCCVWI